MSSRRDEIKVDMSDATKLDGCHLVNNAFQHASSMPHGYGVVALSLILTPMVMAYALIVLPLMALKRTLLDHAPRR